jgi:hypothetical protein
LQQPPCPFGQPQALEEGVGDSATFTIISLIIKGHSGMLPRGDAAGEG